MLELLPEVENNLKELKDKGIDINSLIKDAINNSPYVLGKDLFGKYGSGKGNLSTDYKKILKKKIDESIGR